MNEKGILAPSDSGPVLLNAGVALAPAAVSTPSRKIPSLDGLRACSILLVILAHSSWYFPHRIADEPLFESIVGNGRNGVAVFFVISGYLITTLLRREIEKTGTISLRHFYFRRSMRIFPAFYVMMATLAILWAGGWIPEDGPSFLASLTYTNALVPAPKGFYIAHSWSLSIEELFYLFWPFAFLIWHRRQQAIRVALVLIAVMPVVRVAIYFMFSSLRGHENYMVQGWIDTMMIGCVLALVKGNIRWEAWKCRFIGGWTAGLMAILGFILVPMSLLYLPKPMASFANLAVKPTILAVCIGAILLYAIDAPQSVSGRFLNNPVVRHIGILSYSLYLWQQLFLAPESHLLPYGWAFAFAAAEISFWVVERPSLRLRAWIENAFMLRKRFALIK